MFDVATATDRIAATLLNAQADYLRTAEEYAEQGYRMPTCFHGTSQWVDYDVMCPGCEEGDVNEYSTYAEVWACAREAAEAEQAREASDRERDHAHALFVHGYVVSGSITPQQAGRL